MAPHFILIGNYPPDDQESMLRFAELLATGFRSYGVTVECIHPRTILAGQRTSTNHGFWKWVGYVDKFVLFPIFLRRKVAKSRREFGDAVRYHVCDHSNAAYLAYIPKHQTAITCHDVLAIRGALGYPATYSPASRTGVFLQRWILKHLRQAQRIACVSELTRKQLCEVAGTGEAKPGWRLIHNALNADFARIEPQEAKSLLELRGVRLSKPFLLHVGSNALRKNRPMLLRMMHQAGARWSGDVCFAGEPADENLDREARELGLQGRVQSVSKPDHRTLCALYSLAHALVFPSFSEGFGWPVVEAQACGTPVIASNTDPLPEVSGGAALHADPQDAESFVAKLLVLNDQSVRESLVAQGLKNAARFKLPLMMEKYLALHGLNDLTSARVVA